MAVLEKELKILIEEDAYVKLKNYFSPTNSVDQINYYFDTDRWELSKNNITLRIREVDESYRLCLKCKKSKSNNLNFSLEYERQINLEQLNEVINNKSSILKLLEEDANKHLKTLNILVEDIKYVGNILNNRLKFSYNQNTIELDRSLFPNQNVSYEIEVEDISSKEESKTILTFLKHLGINYIINDISKYQRFIEAKTKSPC